MKYIQAFIYVTIMSMWYILGVIITTSILPFMFVLAVFIDMWWRLEYKEARYSLDEIVSDIKYLYSYKWIEEGLNTILKS